MQQQLIALLTLLLTVLSSVPAQVPPAAAGTSAGQTVPAALAAHVEKLGYQLEFILDGYTGDTPPTVTIRSVTGAVYADNEPATADGTYILDTIDRKQVVADQLTYTWKTADGRTLSGEYLYTNPLSKFQWQVTQTEHLVLYHTAPLEQEEAALLDGAAQRVSDLVGVPLPDPHMVVYLLPDAQSLMDLCLALGDTQPPPTLSGFGYPGYIFIKGGVPAQEKAILVSHETVHSLGSFSELSFLAEGLPQYAMMMEMAYAARTQGYESERRKKFFDNLMNLTTSVKVGGFNKVVLGAQPPFEPQERNMYTVGCAFMLYVRSEYGDEGIRKLFARYRQDATDKNVVASFFGESMTEVQRLFNIYVGHGEALRDAHTVFDYAG